jgi:hypothetical protein
MRYGGPDVITLLDDFAAVQRKSCFRMTQSWQQTEFLATLNGLGPPRCAELAKGAGTMGLYRVLGDEELSGDLAIAEAAGDEAEDFKLAGGNADALLLACVQGKSRSWLRDRERSGDGHFSHHYRLPSARDAEAEPDADGSEENGNECSVELERMLDYDESVFGVLECDDEDAADKTEGQDVALHPASLAKPESSRTTILKA